jgi:Zn-dependent membrane protease YugP
VNLSPEVDNGSSIASAAVAAHECGHAVQHADAYSWLMLRSRLVPAVQFSSSLVQWVIIGVWRPINVFPQICRRVLFSRPDYPLHYYPAG